MYLVMRVWGRHVNRQKWREFFRSCAHCERWDGESRYSRIRNELSALVATEFQHKLRHECGRTYLNLTDPDSGRERPPALLRECLDECVEILERGRHQLG